jgi:hypothetical protein
VTVPAYPSLSVSVAELPPRVRDLALALARPTALHSPVEVLTGLIEVLAWMIARRAILGQHDLEWIAPVVEICTRRVRDQACAIYVAAAGERP